MKIKLKCSGELVLHWKFSYSNILTAEKYWKFSRKIWWKFSEIFQKNMKFSGQFFRLTSLLGRMLILRRVWFLVIHVVNVSVYYSAGPIVQQSASDMIHIQSQSRRWPSRGVPSPAHTTRTPEQSLPGRLTPRSRRTPPPRHRPPSPPQPIPTSSSRSRPRSPASSRRPTLPTRLRANCWSCTRPIRRRLRRSRPVARWCVRQRPGSVVEPYRWPSESPSYQQVRTLSRRLVQTTLRSDSDPGLLHT